MMLRFAKAALAALVLLAAGAAAAQGKAYVGNFKDNTVSVVDLQAGAVSATVPVAAGPHGMAISADGRVVYVTGDGSSSMSIIDSATNQVSKTVEVGKTPHGVALTPDGRTLLVCVYGEDRLAVIDTATQAQVATIPVLKPHTVAVRPDGKVAYVSSQEPGKFALVIVDLSSRAATGSVPLNQPPRDLEFGPGGKALYFTKAGTNAIEVLDPSTDKVVAEIATGASPHIASVFRGAAYGTAVVQGPGELLLFDPATNAAVKSVAVGKQPHWMASADGKMVAVTNEGSNDLTLVDLSSGQTKTIAVGNAPRKVVVQPAGTPRADASKVSIANFAFAPADLVVNAGDRVTWVNDDGPPHGLAFKDGAPAPDLMLPGAQFTRAFDRAGTFDYVCAVHPYMIGRVTVKAQ
ncbi:MAG TPA: plastocyanin/azurin family copper-binding protein [Casimicrobiaceae bacterium]|nr:plastocyanin/azurin family copper-binding protein [Casimicrobiaceae bacterium]